MQERYRMKFHLMPPTGWMNDPNGLCFYKGFYHVFFQYSPQTPRGELKSWGHYRSSDLLHWEYLGIAVRPDTAEDKDGAYSGCCFTGDGRMELFYTGNVKEEGDFDYIYAGRGANILYRSSEDGIRFSEKEVLLNGRDYPEGYSCHIRDPLVWKEETDYYMVLGARKGQPGEDPDRGAILVYHSTDKKRWTFLKELSTRQLFGHMWECPDYFILQGQPVLSTCPQGLAAETLRFQNHDQSGYFLMPYRIQEQEDLSEQSFREWDMGFDFYAPQSFEAPDGRRLLIGWVGLPEADYTNEATIREGWQHCLSLPRELSVRQGKILQQPMRELTMLRGQEHQLMEGRIELPGNAIDLEVSFADAAQRKEILLNEELRIAFADGILKLEFLNDSGEGRTCRRSESRKLKNIRVLYDVSIVEIYANDGSEVFTTRYYPKQQEYTSLQISGTVENAGIWNILEWRLG